MSNRAAIIMATYNGEKFIQEQIESIRKQSFTNWDLYITDDGSTDSTIDLLNKLSIIDKRIKPVIHNNGKHGACLNFYNGIRELKKKAEDYDYFFFSDQDDIWKEDKIKYQIDRMQKSDNDIVLCYSDLAFMDYYGVPIGVLMSDIHDIKIVNPYDIYMNQTFVWGNTMCITRKLMDILVIPDDIKNYCSHDHYIPFYACAYGKFEYIEEPLVYYRRHPENVSGIPPKYTIVSAVKALRGKVNNLVNSHAVNYDNVLTFAKNTKERSELTEDIMKCFDVGGFAALSFIRKYHITPGANVYNGWANLLILLLGLYKKSAIFKQKG